VRVSNGYVVLCVMVAGILGFVGCGGGSSNSGGGTGGTPSVSMAAFPAQIGAGANWQFSANVVGGSAGQGVTWAVSTPGGGTIDATGLYIAPTTGTFPMPVTVTVASQSDSSLSATADITITQTDPLGTATGTTIACPEFSDGLPASTSTCYQVKTSCEGLADMNAYLKVNQPAGAALGTVMFGTGTGGTALYDNDAPDFFNGTTNGGLAVVQNILNGGFTTVQVSFGPPFSDQTPNGWLTGPGGVRRAACRYATVAQWVYQNIHNSNASAPLCATGNSGGSGAIAYALNDYGLDSIFSMVEETSGPPMTRLDQACLPPTSSVCTQQPFTCNAGDPQQGLSTCYSVDEAGIVDAAYPQPLCKNAINGIAPPDGFFLSDSILGGPPRTFSKTRVNVLVGGQDSTSAVEQGLLWVNTISAPIKTQACISDAPHPMPSAEDAALAIATDIQNLCKVQ
jgi:hypothetical protein